MAKNIEQVLEFWFGTFPDAYHSDPARADMWFKNGARYDQRIFLDFGDLHQQAIEGGLDHWPSSPRGRLALIVLLDQFSRHIYRGQAGAFASDEQAQALCLDGISTGDDLRLHPVERSFFYMPLMHAEAIERQDLGIEAYTRLAEDIPEQHRQPFNVTLDFARKHHYVIECFGRFPELNEILGRESTTEEIEFMKSDEYSFL